ncbi:hypothetical protein F5883DRAFT_49059 [Diaporthe sp. PMI_573]|nr:hypothetical protein F5883DRAFT_49059 [Diaporthaceae sp. PMI_573]
MLATLLLAASAIPLPATGLASALAQAPQDEAPFTQKAEGAFFFSSFAPLKSKKVHLNHYVHSHPQCQFRPVQLDSSAIEVDRDALF